MLIIPRGTLVHEGLSTLRVELPKVFSRLKTDSLTGVLRVYFTLSDCHVFYENGEAKGAIYTEANTKYEGAEALAALCRTAASTPGSIDVYALSKDTIRYFVGICKGTIAFDNTPIAQFDPRVVLTPIREAKSSAVLITSIPQTAALSEKSSMIILENGASVGFLHSNTLEIVNDNTQSQEIGKNSLAFVSLINCVFPMTTPPMDLFDIVDIDKLWKTKVDFGTLSTESSVNPVVLAQFEKAKKVFVDVIGGIGAIAFDKEVKKLGGPSIIAEQKLLAKLLVNLKEQALMLEKESVVDKAISVLQKELKF